MSHKQAWKLIKKCPLHLIIESSHEMQLSGKFSFACEINWGCGDETLLLPLPSSRWWDDAPRAALSNKKVPPSELRECEKLANLYFKATQKRPGKVFPLRSFCVALQTSFIRHSADVSLSFDKKSRLHRKKWVERGWKSYLIRKLRRFFMPNIVSLFRVSFSSLWDWKWSC